MLTSILAPNPSVMTLTGTRTYVLGQRTVVIIDPGSAERSHLEAIVRAAGAARISCILLTHRHPDHESGADPLAEQLGAPVRAIGVGTLMDGDVLDTDAGALVTIHAPGHTPDHAVFHWPDGDAVFCGDLMMGGLDTALVAAPEGDLRAYLASLERVRALGVRTIHPAHGPSLEDAGAAIDAYVRHRADRLNQVQRVLETGPASAERIAAAVYGGTIPSELRSVAVGAVRAYLEYLAAEGIAEAREDRWTHRAPSIQD